MRRTWLAAALAAAPLLAQTPAPAPPRTIKTGEIRVVAGGPVPTPVPVGPRTVKTGEIRVIAGDPVPTPAPVKPRTINTGPIRVVAEPAPAKGK